MNKIIELTWLKFLGVKGPENIKSLTIIELLISMIIVSLMVVSFYSLETYGHKEVITADRRAKIQNSLAYCLEHMSKYVQQANGASNRKPIQYRPGPGPVGANGFRVYIDLRNPQTPSVLTDDGWIDYTLAANTLTATCTANGGNCPFAAEALTDRIIAGVVGGSVMPVSPASGFYVLVNSEGNSVDVGLVGRYTPTEAVSKGGALITPDEINPQEEMKTRLSCNNISMN